MCIEDKIFLKITVNNKITIIHSLDQSFRIDRAIWFAQYFARNADQQRYVYVSSRLIALDVFALL